MTEILPQRPELLAPAGSWDCAKAAVENGADAIYFGLERFNARMRAENFTEADLPELMAFLHCRGVKGYVTLNTLVFPQELQDADRYLRTIIAAGVDAAIVQDVGICRLIRHLSPDFPIHASTQMTVTSAAGVEFARNLGCQLVVLARECSLAEIGKIQRQMGDRGASLPIEVFVHGALCVAYSGQCLTSESLGGRSANRGECAQACRMTYELVADGKTVDLGNRQYLLSPQDLAGLEVLPELVKAGVASLKIEGRLKTAEYVASVTRVYREALDRTMNDAHYTVTQQECYDLEMAFSRGLYTGWFRGINNQELVRADFGKKRGVELGEVTRIGKTEVTVCLLPKSCPIQPGDGVVFDGGRSESGGRIYQVKRQGKEVTLSFGRRDLDLRRLKVGDKVWKTSDPEFDRRVRQSFTGEKPQFQRPLTIEVDGEIDRPLVAIARDELGHIVRIESAIPLVGAQTQPLTAERLQSQFDRLGNTPFYLASLENRLTDAAMLPVSELNRMRRELVAQLEALRSQPLRWQLNAEAKLDELLPEVEKPNPPTPFQQKTFSACPSQEGARGRWEGGVSSSPDRGGVGEGSNLIALVRHLPQLQAALEAGIETLYCEFEDPRGYREAVRRVRQGNPTATIWVAPPRIAKPGENYILQQVRSSDADGYLVRNYDHLTFFKSDRCVGDFSLNVANALSADYFKNQFGLERLTASYDLNIQQLEDLLVSCPPQWFEVTIHQHMPMFHMEHCVFCAFLSAGTDYTNCGRPCEKYEVKLRDRIGTEHILQADAGCRNTVFNGVAQTGAEYVPHLLELGIRDFRLEFVRETPTEIAATLDCYRQLLQGKISGSQLWRDLKLQNRLGVTRGALRTHSRER
ncbi:MAG TPA: U32 family peptidase [Oscillatoriales cyanobacterium M59_W2019_021]|nr:MAG: U32 family peptidase [Cyanobacteria bacterium J055]HIK31992.1 U32 family peptidase [Oscillatoriales cyanobacterium M4454_W2019_049]HIK49490.1 U32 family peptidase [Oscillatoriales cyanobacterium M59_W2019_021]